MIRDNEENNGIYLKVERFPGFCYLFFAASGFLSFLDIGCDLLYNPILARVLTNV